MVPPFLLCIFSGSQMAVSYFLVGLVSVALAVAQSIGDATLTTTITSDGSTIISTYVGTAFDSTQSLAQTTITTYTTEIPTLGIHPVVSISHSRYDHNSLDQRWNNISYYTNHRGSDWAHHERARQRL